MESIVIPEGITKIEDNVFGDCRSLKSVKLPTNITAIGSRAFDGCSSLKSITFGEGMERIPNGLCKSMRSMKIVTLPASLKRIDDDAFRDCNVERVNYMGDIASWCTIEFGNLFSNPLDGGHLYINNEEVTELVIPEGIKEIQYSAFYGCENLKKVKIPFTVTAIRSDAFFLCYNLSEVEFAADKNGKTNLKTIEPYAFACPSLKSIKLNVWSIL